MTYLRVSSSKLVAHAHQHNSESVRGGQVAEEMDSPREKKKMYGWREEAQQKEKSREEGFFSKCCKLQTPQGTWCFKNEET